MYTLLVHINVAGVDPNKVNNVASLFTWFVPYISEDSEVVVMKPDYAMMFKYFGGGAKYFIEQCVSLAKAHLKEKLNPKKLTYQ